MKELTQVGYVIEGQGKPMTRDELVRYIRKVKEKGDDLKQLWQSIQTKQKVRLASDLRLSPVPEVFKGVATIQGIKAMNDYMALQNVKALNYKSMIRMPKMIHTIESSKFSQAYPNAVLTFNQAVNTPISPTTTIKHNASGSKSITFAKGFPQVGNNSVIPRYIPTYQNVPYRKDYLVSLHDRIESDKVPPYKRGHLEAFVALYDELSQVAQSTYYGSGTFEGQIGRLKAVWEVHDKTKQASYVKNLGYTNYTKIMDKWFPLGHPFASLNSYNYSELDPRLFKINWEADPGIYWHTDSTGKYIMNIKKFEISDQEVILYSMLLSDFDGRKNVVLKNQPTIEEGKKMAEEDKTIKYSIASKLWYRVEEVPLTEVMKKWEWLRLTELKNKGEIYSREQYTSNTRNYWPTISFSSLVPQALMRNVMNDLPYFSQLNYDDYIKENGDFNKIKYTAQLRNGSRILVGWTPWHGGLDKLYNDVILAMEGSKVNEPFCLVYADNLYVIVKIANGSLLWLSLDASKMEGCVETALVENEISRQISYLTNYKALQFQKHGVELGADYTIAPGYVKYLMNMFPQQATNGISVIADKQLKSKTMGSGIMGTAYFNTAKMILLAENIERNKIVPVAKENGHWALTNDFNQAVRMVGLVMKLEAVVENFDQLQDDHNLGKVFNLDLLGYDCTISKIGDTNYVIPVLNKERLMKSYLYQKNYVKKDGSSKLSEPEQHLLTLVRMRAIYSLGAWFYQPMNFEVEYLAKKSLKWLKNNVSDWSEALSDASYLMQVGEENDIPLFTPEMAESLVTLSLGYPTLYEVLSLILTKDIAEQHIAYLVSNEEGVFPPSLAPPSVLNKIQEGLGRSKFDPIVIDSQKTVAPIISSIFSFNLPTVGKSITAKDVEKAPEVFKEKEELTTGQMTHLPKTKESKESGNLGMDRLYSMIRRLAGFKVSMRVPIPQQYRKGKPPKEPLKAAKITFLRETSQYFNIPFEKLMADKLLLQEIFKIFYPTYYHRDVLDVDEGRTANITGLILTTHTHKKLAFTDVTTRLHLKEGTMWNPKPDVEWYRLRGITDLSTPWTVPESLLVK